jgi:hypothetical protein
MANDNLEWNLIYGLQCVNNAVPVINAIHQNNLVAPVGKLILKYPRIEIGKLVRGH